MAADKGPAQRIFSRAMMRAVTAEFTAMFLFVYVCVGCALTTTATAPGASAAAAPLLTISLCFGLTIFVLAHIFGHVSGAHINPAVTFALIISKQIDVVKGLLYMAAQFLASIIATPLLMVTMALKPETLGGYNSLSGPEDNKIFRAFFTEMILTFLLIMTVFATIDPSRENTAMGPLAIGMAVGVAHLIAVPITGCGINPARSLGPGLFADQEAAREGLWVFIIAPFVGAAIGALMYPMWFAEKNFSGGLVSRFHGHEQEENREQPKKEKKIFAPDLEAMDLTEDC